MARVHHRAPHGHTGFHEPRSAHQRAGENIGEARTQTRAVSAPRLTRRHPINRNCLHLSTNNAARGSHNPRITPAHILVQAKARRHRNGCFHGHGARGRSRRAPPPHCCRERPAAASFSGESSFHSSAHVLSATRVCAGRGAVVQPGQRTGRQTVGPSPRRRTPQLDGIVQCRASSSTLRDLIPPLFSLVLDQVSPARARDVKAGRCAVARA